MLADFNRQLFGEFFKWRELNKKIFSIYILSWCGGSILCAQGLNYALVAYAASIKRLWSLWAVLFSSVVLREKNIGRKVMATGIMIAGILVTIIFG